MKRLFPWIIILSLAPLASAGPMEDYCRESAAKRDIAQADCVQAEKDAQTELASMKVDKALLEYCESIVGESQVLIRVCLKKEAERVKAQK